MNGIDVVAELASADAALTAVVSSAHMLAGSIPLNATLPAISLAVISASHNAVVTPGETRRMTERVQATIAASSYEQKDQVLELLRHACADKIGAFAGLAQVTVHMDGTGPDFENEDASIFFQTQDFRVAFNRPV